MHVGYERKAQRIALTVQQFPTPYQSNYQYYSHGSYAILHAFLRNTYSLSFFLRALLERGRVGALLL
jgi:hypothetical protein